MLLSSVALVYKACVTVTPQTLVNVELIDIVAILFTGVSGFDSLDQWHREQKKIKSQIPAEQNV